MKLVAISDIHGYLIPEEQMPDGDLLVIAGDVCPFKGGHSIKTQTKWLIDNFSSWLRLMKKKYGQVVWIGGNHDFALDEIDAAWGTPSGTVYLRDMTVKVNGLVIHGTPWSVEFGRWAFMKPDMDLIDYYASIPDDAEIVVSHTPPWSVLDANRNGNPCGSKALLDKLDTLANLKWVICGHIHEEGGGIAELSSGAKVANVSILDEFYNPWARSPTVIEV